MASDDANASDGDIDVPTEGVSAAVPAVKPGTSSALTPKLREAQRRSVLRADRIRTQVPVELLTREDFTPVSFFFRQFFISPKLMMRRVIATFQQLLRTSIQWQVGTVVVILGVIVAILLAFSISILLRDKLEENKLTTATEEIERARTAVESRLRATDSTLSVQQKLQSARAVIAASPTSDSVVSGSQSSVFFPVLIARNSDTQAEDDEVMPAGKVIPDRLREQIQASQMAWQYARFAFGQTSSSTEKAFIIGTPVASNNPSRLELYLVFPLRNDEETMRVTNSLTIFTSALLVLLLVAIMLYFSRAMVQPLREVSQTAEEFSQGKLDARVAASGENEVARLGRNFNDMADKLSEQISNLTEFGTLQRQFSSDVSHELVTPLTSVRMAADLIHDQSEDMDPVMQRAAKLMITELDRFEALLQDLLEISRHDAGVANLAAEKIDFRGVVRSAFTPIASIAHDMKVEFIFDLPDEPTIIEADTRRSERILRNLFANAVDHAEGRPVLVTLKTDDHALAITVVDNGVGLKPSQCEMVFSRFWRADTSRERRTGGTGLGLAIAREDAQLHGGTLDAIGELGVGTCFRLILPRTVGAAVPTPPLPLAVTTIETPGDDDE